MGTTEESSNNPDLREELYDLFDKSTAAYKAGDNDNGHTFGTLAGIVLAEISEDSSSIEEGDN